MTKRVLPLLLMLTCFPSDVSAEYRTWTDPDGRQFEAEILTVQGGKVFLKKRSGDALAIDLTKLSDADRAFLEASLKKDTPAEPTTPQEACVVLEMKMTQGEYSRTQHTLAAYVLRRGDTGYFIAGPPLRRRNSNPPDPTAEYHIVFQFGTDSALRIATRPVGTYEVQHRTLTVWKISGPKFPAPLPIAKQTPAVGAKVKFHQMHITTKRDEPPTANRSEATGTFGEIQRGADGKIAQYRTEAAGVLSLAIVTDQHNRALGLVTRGHSFPTHRPPDPHRPPPEPKVLTQTILPLTTLINDARPRFRSIKLIAKSWGRAGYDYKIEADVQDPFGLAKAARVFFTTADKQSLGKPAMITLKQTPLIQTPSPEPTRSEWRDPTPPNEKTLPNYTASLEYVLHNGSQGSTTSIEVEMELTAYHVARADQQIPLLDGGIRITHDVPAGERKLPKPEEIKIPEPAPARSDAAVPSSAAEDMKVFSLRELRFKHPNKTGGGHTLVPPADAFCWSPAGDAFYFLDREGRVARASSAEVRTTHRIHLPISARAYFLGRTPDLQATQDGIVVLAKPATRGRGGTQLWILDPATLKVRHVVQVSNARSMAASPKSPFVFLSGNGIQALDVRTAQIVTRTHAPIRRSKSAAKDDKRDVKGDVGGSPQIHLSGNGKWLVSETRSRPACLQRYRVDGPHLVWQGAFGGSATTVLSSPELLKSRPSSRTYLDSSLPYVKPTFMELLSGIEPDGDWFGKKIIHGNMKIVRKANTDRGWIPGGYEFLAANAAGDRLLVQGQTAESRGLHILNAKHEKLGSCPSPSTVRNPNARFHSNGREAVLWFQTSYDPRLIYFKFK